MSLATDPNANANQAMEQCLSQLYQAYQVAQKLQIHLDKTAAALSRCGSTSINRNLTCYQEVFTRSLSAIDLLNQTANILNELGFKQPQIQRMLNAAADLKHPQGQFRAGDMSIPQPRFAAGSQVVYHSNQPDVMRGVVIALTYDLAEEKWRYDLIPHDPTDCRTMWFDEAELSLDKVCIGDQSND